MSSIVRTWSSISHRPTKNLANNINSTHNHHTTIKNTKTTYGRMIKIRNFSSVIIPYDDTKPEMDIILQRRRRGYFSNRSNISKSCFFSQWSYRRAVTWNRANMENLFLCKTYPATTTNAPALMIQHSSFSSTSNQDDNNDTPADKKLHEKLKEILPYPNLASKIQRYVSQYEKLLEESSSIETVDGQDGSSQSGGGGSFSSSTQQKMFQLSPLASIYLQFQTLQEEIQSMKELSKQAKEDGDGDMLQECLDEITSMEETCQSLGPNMINALLTVVQILSSDGDNSNKTALSGQQDASADAIIELRAGTGGDEACLFCSELVESYKKTCKMQGWQYEVLNMSKTDLGGIKEAAISISSNSSFGGGYGNSAGEVQLGPYQFFCYESGVHRVQRVPINDVRIHTSAASVGVLPAPKDSKHGADSLLPASELRIETMRASGAGGQHVNTTDSAVRITHIPTGITAAIQDERSQHKNKAKALKLIAARVNDQIQRKEAEKRGNAKNSLMGGGDRSERIRTYNYPQDRVTDHRCKHSEHGIDKLLGDGGEDTGLVGIFAPILRQMEKEELLIQMEDEEVQLQQQQVRRKK